MQRRHHRRGHDVLHSTNEQMTRRRVDVNVAKAKLPARDRSHQPIRRERGVLRRRDVQRLVQVEATMDLPHTRFSSKTSFCPSSFLWRHLELRSFGRSFGRSFCIRLQNCRVRSCSLHAGGSLSISLSLSPQGLHALVTAQLWRIAQDTGAVRTRGRFLM